MNNRTNFTRHDIDPSGHIQDHWSTILECEGKCIALGNLYLSKGDMVGLSRSQEVLELLQKAKVMAEFVKLQLEVKRIAKQQGSSASYSFQSKYSVPALLKFIQEYGDFDKFWDDIPDALAFLNQDINKLRFTKTS